MTKAEKAYRRHVKPAGIGLMLYGLVICVASPFVPASTFDYFPLPFLQTLFTKKVVLVLLALSMIVIGRGLLRKQFWSWIGLFVLVVGVTLYIGLAAQLGFMAGVSLPFGMTTEAFALLQIANSAAIGAMFYFLYRPVFVAKWAA